MHSDAMTIESTQTLIVLTRKKKNRIRIVVMAMAVVFEGREG